MEMQSTVLSLVDLYEDNSEVFSFLDTKVNILNEENEKWKVVLHSHIDKVLQSKKFLKLETLGAGLDWLNTTKPLTLDEDLKDKVIVLDFFTYCCINCEHALPYLKEVEKTFEPELLVIGVHSPKFPNEKAIDSVKNAVLRNKITHPVINDPENSLWNKLGVYCWPTVLILSPDHRVLFSLVGEMQIEKLSYLCNETISYFKMHTVPLNKNQLGLITAQDDYSNILLYPSGISISGRHVMISDTGHNRLLLMTIDGEVLHVIGSGKSGCSDGLFTSSSFDRPHGTVWWKTDIVFVADTGNHSIRMIDLKHLSVSTIFNGRLLDKECNDGVEVFTSPWDVCVAPQLGSDMSQLNVLYIAVAGSHQIWNLNLEYSVFESRQNSSFKCSPFAGNGKEECRNNTYRMKAGFAQPSGICYSESMPGTLFIADSESSTIRSISLVDGSVKTIVGGGLDPKDLFQYGDKDSIGHDVKLQHPIGICVMEEKILCITDTYNHKLKVVRMKSTNDCLTVAGSGTRGNNNKTSALESEFDEPSGICFSSLKNGVLVVDTNNHCIKFVDPGRNVIKFLPVIFSNRDECDGMHSNLVEHSMQLEDSSQHIIFCQDTKYIKINLGYGGKMECTFKLNQPGVSLASGFKECPSLAISCKRSWQVHFEESLFDPSKQPALVIKCYDNVTGIHNSYEVEVQSNLILCDNIKNICFPKKFDMKIDIELSTTGPDRYEGLFLF